MNSLVKRHKIASSHRILLKNSDAIVSWQGINQRKDFLLTIWSPILIKNKVFGAIMLRENGKCNHEQTSVDGSSRPDLMVICSYTITLSLSFLSYIWALVCRLLFLFYWHTRWAQMKKWNERTHGQPLQRIVCKRSDRGLQSCLSDNLAFIQMLL